MATVSHGDYLTSARPDSDFALVYTTKQGVKVRKLPIYDRAHVRNALARFNQTDMPADKRKDAMARILARAKQFKIEAAGLEG